MKTKTRKVRAVLRSVSSQRIAYKPYGYELGFESEPLYRIEKVMGVGDVVMPIPPHPTVFVELEIPEEFIIQPGADHIVISLQGLNAILEVTADSVDELNRAYIKKTQAGGS